MRFLIKSLIIIVLGFASGFFIPFEVDTAYWWGVVAVDCLVGALIIEALGGF